MKSNKFRSQFRPEIVVADARDTERQEARRRIYWLKVELRLTVTFAVCYLVTMIVLDPGIAWASLVLTLGVAIVGLLIGGWASPRGPS